MSKFIINTLLSGFLLWLFGYILGFIFFALVSTNIIGYFIMPFGIIGTIFVLYKFIHLFTLTEYTLLGIIWLIIAIVCDYLFLVLLLKPADGYYKLDVYIYYISTLLIPILFYVFKSNKQQ